MAKQKQPTTEATQDQQNTTAAELSSFDTKKNVCESKLKNLETEITGLEEKLARFVQQEQELGEEVAKMEKEKEELEEDMANLKLEKTELKMEKKNLEEKIAKFEMQKELHAKEQKELEETNSRLTAAMQLLANVNEQLVSVQRQLAEAGAGLNLSKGELYRLNTLLEEKRKEIQGVSNKIEQKQKYRDTVETELASLDSDIAKLTMKLQELKLADSPYSVPQSERAASVIGKTVSVTGEVALPGGGHLGFTKLILPPHLRDECESLKSPPEQLQSKYALLGEYTQRIFLSPGLALLGETNDVQGRVENLWKTMESLQLFDTKQLKYVKESKAWFLKGAQALCSTSGSTKLDFCLISTNEDYPELALGVWENKGSESSTHNCTAQAAGYASGIAMAMRGVGVATRDIIVPIVSFTGASIQFGVTYMLEPSYPVYATVSELIDIGNHESLPRLSDWLHWFIARCSRNSELLRGKAKVPTSLRIELSDSVYYLKEFGPDNKAIQLYGSVTATLQHMWQVFEVLYKHPAGRKVVEFPVAICNQLDQQVLNANPNCKTFKHQMLAFDNLRRNDYPGGPYTLGLPDCVENPDDWNAVITALRGAFGAVHDAGVVHGDPYPSNYLWRKNKEGGHIDIKIIDWDSAHLCRQGAKWEENLQKVFADFFGLDEHHYLLKKEHDLYFLDVLRWLPTTADGLLCCSSLRATVLAQYDTDEKAVHNLNKAFRDAIDLYNGEEPWKNDKTYISIDDFTQRK